MSLALISIGGAQNVGETWFSDAYGERTGLIDLPAATEELFLPGAHTVLYIPSKTPNEFALVSAPGDGLACWLGQADLRSEEMERIIRELLGSEKLLLLTAGIDDCPIPSDELIAAGRPLQGSEDFAVLAAYRSGLDRPLTIEINRSLLTGRPELAWMEGLTRALVLSGIWCRLRTGGPGHHWPGSVAGWLAATWGS